VLGCLLVTLGCLLVTLGCLLVTLGCLLIQTSQAPLYKSASKQADSSMLAWLLESRLVVGEVVSVAVK
jgi:uncharacterized membrane protein